MRLFKVTIQAERLAGGEDRKEAALAVLKDLEIDLKFRECPAIKIEPIERKAR